MRFFLSALLLALALSSCGYRLGTGGITEQYSKISVPYVKDDLDGSLTAAIIQEIGRSSSLEYTSCPEELILEVKIIDFNDENIGFRYDRRKRGGLKKRIIPIETRMTENVEVTLTDLSGKVILGPAVVTASIDFDHDYYSSHHSVNIFSLGQLNDIESAEDIVHIPLNQRLARAIVNYILDSW